MNWNYISGFFDADGYISYLHVSKDTNKTVVFGFTNTERSILEQIQEYIYNETKQKGFIVEKSPKKTNHKIGYDLKYAFLNKALIILPNIKSFHIKKQHRINLVLKQLKDITPRNGRYNSDILNQRQQFEFDFFNPKVS